MKYAAVVGGALMLLLASASAVKPEPSLSLTRSDWSQTVEQQSPNFIEFNCGGNPSDPGCDPSSWVVNPDRSCMWDIDDFQDYAGFKVDIPTGTEVITDVCVTADADAHPLSIDLRATTPNLLVTVSNIPGAVTVVSPVIDGRKYRYCAAMLSERYLKADSLVVTIPNSNEGWGVPSTVRMSIVNNDRRTAKDVNVVEQFGITAVSKTC